MWDALHSRCLPSVWNAQRDGDRGAPMLQIALGWSIAALLPLYPGPLSATMGGFRPLFQRGRWEVPTVCSAASAPRSLCWPNSSRLRLRDARAVVSSIQQRSPGWWHPGGAGHTVAVAHTMRCSSSLPSTSISPFSSVFSTRNRKKRAPLPVNCSWRVLFPETSAEWRVIFAHQRASPATMLCPGWAARSCHGFVVGTGRPRHQLWTERKSPAAARGDRRIPSVRGRDRDRNGVTPRFQSRQLRVDFYLPDMVRGYRKGMGHESAQSEYLHRSPG